MPCKQCKDKSCLVNGKLCAKLEKLLPPMSTGQLPHTISLNSDYLDQVIWEKHEGVYDFKKRKKH